MIFLGFGRTTADALEVCIIFGTAPQGHFVASLGRARSLRSLAKPLSRWSDVNSAPQSTTLRLVS